MRQQDLLPARSPVWVSAWNERFRAIFRRHHVELEAVLREPLGRGRADAAQLRVTERTRSNGDRSSRPMNASTPLMLENTIQSNVSARAQAASSASKLSGGSMRPWAPSMARRPSLPAARRARRTDRAAG